MLEIRDTQVYHGPNIWTRMPSIRLLVDIGELEDRPTDKIPGFTDRLMELIPSLYEHYCSEGHRGGFLERMRHGTWMGHVTEHVALELQHLAGADVGRGKTRADRAPGVYNVIYEYVQEDVGLAAGRLAVRLLNHLIYESEPEFDFRRELEDRVIRLAERLAYGPSTAAIVGEAERRGIPTLRLDPQRSLVQLGYGRFQERIWATVTSKTSHMAVDIAANKDLTSQLLRDIGIPVPQSAVVEDAEEAVEAAARIGYPVVIKPLDGNHGRGVCINLTSADDVRSCFPMAERESRRGAVVVERYIGGKDYRILVVDSEVVAAAERVPAHVVGDGRHSIRQLIDITNADPRRGIGHEKVLTRITVDEQTTKLLEEHGMSLDTIPPVDALVQLKLTGNMSTGGTSIDCTDIIHPDNIEIAREAARVIGLDVAGIDFITPDIAQPVHEVGGAIVEVNAGPGFRMHTHPTVGHPRDVGRAVMDTLFARGANGRVPIIAVTGTNGKTTTARMIAHIMKTAGKKVGLTTTDGIYIDGTQIAAGDMSGPQSAQMVLKNPMIDYAVLETARGGILRRGLGFDHCNIAVVTNVTSDHLGLRGVETIEELARVKSVVPESVFPEGCSILSADNEWTVGMADDARGEIIFFGMDEQSPVIRDHLRERGRAVVLRQTPQGDVIVLVDRKRETTLLRVDEIPATMGGVIRANVANALAAAAAAFVDDVPLDDIRQALRTFSTDFGQTPGRFNLLEIAGRQVLIDYCHNIGALEAMGDFVRRMAAPHSVAVITVPGDRRDEDVRAFGTLSAQIFDELVLRDNNSLRGRKPGEMPSLLKRIVIEAGMAEGHIGTVWNEIESCWAAIERAAPGDLVVLMVDKPTEVWKALTRNTSRQSAHAPVAEGQDTVIAPAVATTDTADRSTPDGHDQEIIGDQHAFEMARTDAQST